MLKQAIFSTLCTFLWQCSGKNIKMTLGLSISANTESRTTLFTENGRHGMLEASNLDAIYYVPPLLDAIMDASVAFIIPQSGRDL